MQKLSLAVFSVLAVLSAVPHTAAAAEFCVVCTGPDAAYRCQVDAGSDGPNSDPRLQLLCISQLATAGKHDSCSVNRTAAKPCAGELRIVALPTHEMPLANPAPAAANPSSEPPAGAPPASDQATTPAGETVEPKSKAPPKTVEELAGQTVQSSKQNLEAAGEAIGGTAKKTGEQIGNAGSAVGGAAKKTWDCVTSLFKNC